MKELIIGTRGSKLALWQANKTAELFRAAVPELEVSVKIVKTKGDKILDVALSKIGDKGLFTKELEQELLDGHVDVCVHSLKDMPTVLSKGLVLAGCLERADPRDSLVAPQGTTLANLPSGARVGTGALRRLSQLRALRDDIEYVEARGNLDTRIAKVHDGTLDAIVLARAGICRMGWEDEIAVDFSLDEVLPAVGQGAIALEVRANDERVIELCSLIRCFRTDVCITAERSIMRLLDGGCQVPIGAYARFEDDKFVLDAFVGRLDGSQLLRSRVEGLLKVPKDASDVQSATEQACKFAKQAVDELTDMGALSLLDEVRVCDDERPLL